MDLTRIFKQLLFLLVTLPGEHARGHCNVCGTKGVAFCSNAWVRAGVCARCRSDARHRILAAALQYHYEFRYVPEHVIPVP